MYTGVHCRQRLPKRALQKQMQQQGVQQQGVQQGHLSISTCTKSFPSILVFFVCLVCFLPAAYLNLVKVIAAPYNLWSSSGSPKYSSQNPGKKLSKNPNHRWLPGRVTANLPDPLANSSITACVAKKRVALNMV